MLDKSGFAEGATLTANLLRGVIPGPVGTTVQPHGASERRISTYPLSDRLGKISRIAGETIRNSGLKVAIWTDVRYPTMLTVKQIDYLPICVMFELFPGDSRY
jgi:hypothetical protein